MPRASSSATACICQLRCCVCLVGDAESSALVFGPCSRVYYQRPARTTVSPGDVLIVRIRSCRLKKRVRCVGASWSTRRYAGTNSVRLSPIAPRWQNGRFSGGAEIKSDNFPLTFRETFLLESRVQQSHTAPPSRPLSEISEQGVVVDWSAFQTQ